AETIERGGQIQFQIANSARHCEESTGRANARPMTGSATKQSISPCKERWIASSLAFLAMTAARATAFSRRNAPESCCIDTLDNEGAGNTGCSVAPAASRAKG